MLHVVRCEAQHLLPLARSLIKKLRATNLPHASQKLVVGGVMVRVSITPEHEYIDISGGACSMDMDSGVVDVRTIYPQNPLIYSPGAFVETARTLQYTAGFTHISPDGKTRTKDGVTVGQFAGKITGGSKKWAGTLPVTANPPASFAPLKLKTTDGSVAYEPKDGNLADKNESAPKVPASNFTGRMRLYVQAMYGQGLYKYPQESVTPYASWWGYDLPGLFIPVADEPVDGVTPPSIGANVSTGVVLDSSGKHWLVLVGNDTAYVFPLIGSACAEASRHLIAPADDTLNPTDKHHLETYILASCRPRSRDGVSVSLGGTFNSVQMGFGWHWNWSGTCADIVENEEYFQGTYNQGFSARPNYALESTHRRLTLTSTSNNGVRTWAASVSTVEKARWTASRNWGGVCYPVYGATPAAGKIIPRWTEYFECDGPFYAFYKEDALQVCRISLTKQKKKDIRNNTPNYTPSLQLLEGNKPGYYDWTTEDADWWAGSFSIGGISYAIPEIKSALGQFSESTVVPDESDPYLGYNGAYANDTDYSIDIGYPSSYSKAIGHADVLASGATYRQYVTQTSSSVSDVYSGMACAVVPFDDAEAIYVWASAGRTRTKSSVTEVVTNAISYGVYTLTWKASESGPPIPSGSFLTYVWGPSGYGDVNVSSGPVSGSTEFTNLYVTQVLHCGKGVIEVADMEGSMNDYLVPQFEEAGPIFSVKTSAKSGADAAVFNPFSPPSNVAAFNYHFPVIVGWA